VTAFRNLVRLLGPAVGAYALAVRPRLLRWGATDEEVRRPFPGAELVPNGRRSATMAATIDAPPPLVWVWLLQMGSDRDGWYSWDGLGKRDGADGNGADGDGAAGNHVHPDWHSISVGDRLTSVPSAPAWFEVAALERHRFLGLTADRNSDTGGPHPHFHRDTMWGFLLEELPGDRTRLVVSGYADIQPRLLGTLGNFLFWDLAHWTIQMRQFANLNRRAAALVEIPSPSAIDRDSVPA
jgi:proline iminopeptidase